MLKSFDQNQSASIINSDWNGFMGEATWPRGQSNGYGRYRYNGFYI